MLEVVEGRPAQLTVCLLGGTGFVGTELAIRLAMEGHWVRIPIRTPGGYEPLRVLDTVRLIPVDVHNPATLARLFAGADVIINLIGILNEHGRATFQSVHVDLADKVVRAARTTGVKRLLHMSSLGADAAAPSQYLRSKAEAEARVRKSSAVGWTIFRPSVIFGPRDSLTNRFAHLLRLCGGFMPLARPGARFAPIGVQDVVAAFCRALTDRTTVNETYELCGPEVVTLRELVGLTAKVAGLRCRILPLPDGVARLQGLIMGMLPGKPFSLDNYRSLTVDSVCTANGCAKLGIRPQPLLAVVPTYLKPDPEEEIYRST